MKQFKEMGSVLKRKSLGRPSISDERVEEICQVFMQSPGKSIVHNRVVGPYFFTEPSVNSTIYQDMLELFVIPQLGEIPDVIFQQDGAPPHWACDVRDCLQHHFPECWIW